MKYPNKPADLKINYKVNTYEKIESLFSLREGELPSFHLMLALMGYVNGEKIALNTNDGKSEKSHEFSLRTVYFRNESDLDASYGLLAILDNLELSYDEVINTIAFERTGKTNTPFLRLPNVKIFYEYMLSGIDYFEKEFLIDGFDEIEIAYNIHNFLLKEHFDIEEELAKILLAEEHED